MKNYRITLLFVLILYLIGMSISYTVIADDTNTCVFNTLNDWVYNKTSDAPNSKPYKDVDYRRSLVNDLIKGSMVHDDRPIMPFLAVFFAYKESTFDHNAKGDISNGKAKAHGIMQFHITMRSVCSRQLNLDLRKRYDQIVCFSYWIHELSSSKRCGSLEGALRAYTSKGGSCRGTPKGRRIARHRLKQVNKLYKMCYGDR